MMQRKIKLNYNWRTLTKAVGYLVTAMLCFYTGSVLAQSGGSPGNLGDLASGVTTSFKGIVTLMMAVSYLAGTGFVIASIFKFKQHKDNPQQIPLGTPMAMLLLGIVLIFLPALITPAGSTIFGTNPNSGGLTGKGYSNLPGSNQ